MALISTNIPTLQNQPTQKIQPTVVKEFVAEVIDIILDDTHPDFVSLGGWDIIGLIKYKLLEDNNPKNTSSYSYALPYDSNNKSYPVKGEFVPIITGLPYKSTKGKESTTINYYKKSINIYNTSQYNPYQVDSSFPTNPNHANILPKEGDVILEGRFQNSIKFTSDTEGNPITIIRNGRVNQKNEGKFLKEDINTDDSVIIFSSKGNIPLEKRLNAKSFSINSPQNKSNIQLPNYSANSEDANLQNIKSTPEEQIQIVDNPSLREEDIVDFPVEGYENANNEEFKLDEVIVENPTVYTYQEHETQVVSTEKINRVNLLDYKKYIGFTQKDLPIPIRTLLDTIAYCEGTIGQGDNGYNIGSGYYKVPNWSENYQLGCPQLRLIFYNKQTKQKSFVLTKGYWGRYQYGIDTWKFVNGKNIPFTKRNQDLSASISIKKALGTATYDTLHSYMININGVYKICEKLSRVWASIPNGSINLSYYDITKDGITSKQSSRTCQEIQSFYLTSYKLNGGK